MVIFRLQKYHYWCAHIPVPIDKNFIYSNPSITPPSLLLLEKEMATYSSVLAGRVPWTEKPGGLLSMGLDRVGHNWRALVCVRALEKEMGTHSSVLAWRIPGTGETGGLPSMGLHRVGHDWSDLAAAPALLLFSCSIVSKSLRPHGLQHTRLPCPSWTPGACSNSCPLSWWCHPTISSSVIPSPPAFHLFPASGSFPVSWLFLLGGQSIGVSASAS